MKKKQLRNIPLKQVTSYYSSFGYTIFYTLNFIRNKTNKMSKKYVYLIRIQFKTTYNIISIFKLIKILFI